MMKASNYTAVEPLRDGRKVEIRALRPEDRAGFIAAVGHASPQSLYRRFFGTKRGFTEEEVAFYVNVDFVEHVALVAVAEEDGQALIVGGARYVVGEPGRAEIAFVVIDRYQGQGIGAALLRHLAGIARESGLEELVADVLADNLSMLKVFQKSGFPLTTRRGSGVIQVTLRLG